MQVNAERELRAILANSEGEKQAKINRSEGIKAEMITHSEGEMQKRINEAEGKAEEILAIATATAESISKIGDSLILPGGSQALNLQLGEQYLKQMEKLATKDCRVILPGNLADYEGWMKGAGLAGK